MDPLNRCWQDGSDLPSEDTQEMRFVSESRKRKLLSAELSKYCTLIRISHSGVRKRKTGSGFFSDLRDFGARPNPVKENKKERRPRE